MAATKIAQRRELGTFPVQQAQILAQKTAAKTNDHVDALRVLNNRVFVPLLVDTTLGGTAGVYTTLLTATINTILTSGFLYITLTVSGTHPTVANATIDFRILVDGVLVQGSYDTAGVAGAAFASAILTRVAVKKGAHTVLAQWSTDNNSARINAKTSTQEHANMLVQEAA